jgi:hypothetical protein
MVDQAVGLDEGTVSIARVHYCLICAHRDSSSPGIFDRNGGDVILSSRAANCSFASIPPRVLRTA